ncbi:MAG: YciI family protein [Bacteroidetes bacterium]|nr:YciI family protein [Bacteroidota bacterium]MCW5896807.1 YciI family protein [Bacteroidota bacterium]
MKYMLLVYYSEKEMSDSERDRCYVDSARLSCDLAAEGKFVDASPLQLVDTATSVRVRNGKTLVTDGPFAETHEQLGGYYLIDANDLDEAIGIATRIPVATLGTIEIRPVLEIPGLPGEKRQ